MRNAKCKNKLHFCLTNPGVWMVLAAIVVLLAGGGCGYASDGRRIVNMGGRCHTSFECKNG